MTIAGEQDELVLAFLRFTTEKDILIYLIEYAGCTQTDIVNFVHMSAPTINWHMSRLVESDLINLSKEGKLVTYFIKDPERLANLLRNYFPDIWNNLADKFINWQCHDFQSSRIPLVHAVEPTRTAEGLSLLILVSCTLFLCMMLSFEFP